MHEKMGSPAELEAMYHLMTEPAIAPWSLVSKTNSSLVEASSPVSYIAGFPADAAF